MHVLVIPPRLPLPADTGGKIRTLNILKQINKGCETDLVCFSFGAKDQEYVRELERMGIKVTIVPSGEPGFPQKIGMLLFSGMPYSVAKYKSVRMEEAIRLLRAKNHYDLVHCDHAHMAGYARMFAGIPCVMDEHNVEYRILERCASVEPGIVKKMLYSGQARKMRRFEQRMVNRFSAVFAVSEEDGKLLRQMAESDTVVATLPNGVDTEYFHLKHSSNDAQEEDAVVFTGSMDWLPNDDAAVYCCEQIMPFIWEKRPQIRCFIVGKNPSGHLRSLAARNEQIVVTGCVDDVRQYVAKSKVFVVPLRIGGGTRLKILEAMAMERAVVSTVVGAEGIEVSPGRDIVLADQPQAFAQAVISLLDDRGKRKDLGSNGRRLVEEKYDWNIVGKTLRGVYERLKK